MSQNLNKQKEVTPPVLSADEPTTMPEDAFKGCKAPAPQWAIWLAEDAAIYTRYGRPNCVRRFFLWLFFGWRYTKVKDNA